MFSEGWSSVVVRAQTVGDLRQLHVLRAAVGDDVWTIVYILCPQSTYV